MLPADTRGMGVSEEGELNMSELESFIERRLIDELTREDSQWTYRPDIRTEQDLWDNFKYILEQNNKAKLNDTPLSESEFAKIKNDVSHASFYDAGKWLVGENGCVYVHIQRGNEAIHLQVLNNEQIAGGTSVYEVINQYQAFASETEAGGRDRRFDVTLLINGIPMIHIELKNKDHSYMDGYRQIKKYISEGKFRGLFSNVQMFVVSNAADTKYFAAARDTELNKKFITGWVDEGNHPVCDYIDFAKAVLRIPQAHEMVTKYTVLDNDKRQLLILRPYQIHAISAMRKASKQGISGYIWHTTGSGKTMTSYKASRNLLMDIPSIEKTIFLIDRKDLDTQTTMAFQSYAGNDTIDVDDTENVGKLLKRLTDGRRQMIVTTRQKLQILITRRLKEDSKDYQKLRKLRVAFVVDECHRAVTPDTKRIIERFFSNSLWYGFTGTPIFAENGYELKGDLPQTTDALYGGCLHRYTIKEAIHDEAVLGFMVENMGQKGKSDPAAYDTVTHMRSVLDNILNRSENKLGLQNGRGKTYEAILTVDSIKRAQRYYKLLKDVKEGKDELKISEKITKAYPDFPKFAITYSVSENDEASEVNQAEMKQSLADYNQMFGTSYSLEQIEAYNKNLNVRLSRKEKRYLSREQQLDLVIVVDRLLTGFDAPCLSTLYIDRPPMKYQNLIQAFSRTNRLYDEQKRYGQIVTFQEPDTFKKDIDAALTLYSMGGYGMAVSEDWDKIKQALSISIQSVHALAATPEAVAALSRKQKKAFIHLFRALDHDFAHLKAFLRYEDSVLQELGFSEQEYESYAAMYKNVMEELRPDQDDADTDDPITDDYELVAYHKLQVDFEYILQLLQGFIESLDPEQESYKEEKFDEDLKTIRKLIEEFTKSNPQLGELLSNIVDEIERDKSKYLGQDISVIVNQMKQDVVDREVEAYAKNWCIDPDEVRYQVDNYRYGEIANEMCFREKADYAAYSASTKEPMSKLKYRKALIEDFKNDLMANVQPLLND